MIKKIQTFLITGFLSSCASIPDVTYKYYKTDWKTTIKITQTVGCNSDKTNALILNTPDIKTSYFSNLEKDPIKIKIKDLETLSSDASITMELTTDGRLQAINQESVGQGEAIIKSAVSLATAAIGAKGMNMSFSNKGKVVPECSVLSEWSDKPVSLVYLATIDSNTQVDEIIELSPAPQSKFLYDKLSAILPNFKATITKKTDLISGPSFTKKDSTNVVLLELQEMESVSLSIRSDKDPSEVGDAIIFAPKDKTHTVPIPKAALFGKQTFAIKLSEAGSVTSIGYGKTTGVTGALNSLDSIAKSQSASAEAADLKAQADLIVQQQRLVSCQTKPKDCK